MRRGEPLAERRRSKSGWGFAGALGVQGAPPDLGLPEVAFAGRSNVGKSTLINRLMRSPGLARTSRTPGRTQQVNFFVGDMGLAFADLPGYGYARVPGAVQAGWGPLVERYLGRRETLRGVVVLVDARRGLMEGDRLMLELADAHGKAAEIVLSKIDKLGQSERAKLLRAVASERPGAVPFSAVTGEGEDALWDLLRGWVGPLRPRGPGRSGRASFRE
jgi:GTP-binding protein